jgi:hypothetical protein
MNFESELIELAEGADDEVSNAAMVILRKRFDSSYVWCPELDYAVVKLSECEKIAEKERGE